jgi:hypothetical protein
MAIASMFPLSQQPLEMILVGLNLHGRYAAFTIIGSILGLIGSVVAVHWWGWQLLGLAGVGLVVANVDALWIVVNTCHRLSIPVKDYFVGAYRSPILCCLPFVAGLVLVRVAVPDNPLARLLLSVVVGGGILVPLYWTRILDADMRDRVRKAVKDRMTAWRPAPSGSLP